MKVRIELREAYASQQPGYEMLQKLADELLAPRCRANRWHYESRIKDEQSFALKIETGRVLKLTELEDFLGCAIVVRNSAEIAAAVSQVEDVFEIQSRRPIDATETPHRPSVFEFDDLRLYVKLRSNPAVKRPTEAYAVFEIQIKTFLFHAWSIATHDLIYKADDVNWGRERIAFQVRAMLEHAEVTIQRASQLSDVDVLNRKDPQTRDLLAIIAELRARWDVSQLPRDLRRLAQNIYELLRTVRVSHSRWHELLAEEAQKGALPLDENPYQVTVRLLFLYEPAKVKAYIENPNGRVKLIVYETVPEPAWFDAGATKNLLRLS